MLGQTHRRDAQVHPDAADDQVEGSPKRAEEGKGKPTRPKQRSDEVTGWTASISSVPVTLLYAGWQGDPSGHGVDYRTDCRADGRKGEVGRRSLRLPLGTPSNVSEMKEADAPR